MKPFFAPIFPLLFMAVAAVSCASLTAPERRIDRFPALYHDLSDRHRDLVLRGEVTEGMSQDAVFLAWGRPDIVRSGSRDGRRTEHWAYVDSAPVPRTTIGFGVGGGSSPFHGRFGVHPRFGYSTGLGWNLGTGVDYENHLVRKVDFADGRVVAWERRH